MWIETSLEGGLGMAAPRFIWWVKKDLVVSDRENRMHEITITPSG